MNARRVAPIVVLLLFLPSSLFAGGYSQSDSDAFQDEATAQSISDYMSDGWSEEYELAVPMLGMTLREEMGRIANGAPITGVGVSAITSDGPAHQAGVNAPHTILRGAAVAILLAGGMVFPPVIFGAIALEQSALGDSHDLIVAVDGYRTRNLFQFRSAMRLARPGETVYLRVIRSGERHEIRIPIPPEAGLGLSY